MLIVISPAKTLDFESPLTTGNGTMPVFIPQAKQIMAKLQTLSTKGLAKLMDISANLAELNAHRFATWQEDHAQASVRPALLAFRGDVYQGMEADAYNEEDLAFAQDHLRILSGLYGLLRPLDMIQAYRLEMGTRIKVGRKPNLYAYWGTRITEELNKALDAQGDQVLINLASEEYFDAVSMKALQARVIKPVFMDGKGGKYKVISFWAKKARGMMSSYILLNRLSNPEDLKSFNGGGYVYDPVLSDATNWVFTRDERFELEKGIKKEG